MDDLAHWIIDLGNAVILGLGLGLAGFVALTLLEAIVRAIPPHVPVITPIWNAMKAQIHKCIDWLDRKTRR